MKVRDAMHRDVEWAEPSIGLVELARKMRDLDIGAIPIGENDRLVGMVTDRDPVVRGLAAGKELTEGTARGVMTNGIVFCHDCEDVEDAVRIMEQKKIRRLPVLEKDMRMVGMLSLGGISHAASHEITGEAVAAVSAQSCLIEVAA
jgi:CBS domain-containing protein